MIFRCSVPVIDHRLDIALCLWRSYGSASICSPTAAIAQIEVTEGDR